MINGPLGRQRGGAGGEQGSGMTPGSKPDQGQTGQASEWTRIKLARSVPCEMRPARNVLLGSLSDLPAPLFIQGDETG